MSKHTTMPLEVVGNLVRTPLTEGGFLIADCRGSDGQPHSEEAKANALLFAAAHETADKAMRFTLLVERYLRDDIEDGESVPDLSEVVGEMYALRAHIAKATGSNT